MLAGNDPYQADINAPDTPAPVFAVKAFKHAIFGTPQTVISDERKPLARSLSKSRGQGKDTKWENWSSRNQTATRDNSNYIDGENGDDDDRDYIDNHYMSFSKRPSSPSKPNGILMTPGTGPVRRKTVSFGTHAPSEERGLEVRPAYARNKSDLSTELPGKFPSPWTPKAINDALPRPLSSNGQIGSVDARDFHTAAPLELKFPASKSRDDTDITFDFETPRSESGRYWQAQYRSYAEKSAYEVRKLLQKQQAAKQYAKKKDLEAMEMATKLKDERRRHRLRERALECQLKEQREKLAQHDAEKQNYARQNVALKKRIEELQEQQKKQSQQQLYRSNTGHGLRRAHSSAGGRGSGSGYGSGYGSGLGSEERHSGTSASVAAGNGSKTSSFGSDSFRISSSTSSQNKEFEKHDSVMGKIASGDASKSPPCGVMKATATLAQLMDEDPQMSFLHPPSDTENTSPRRSRRGGSRPESAMKSLDRADERPKQKSSSRIETMRDSHSSTSSRIRPLSDSKGEEGNVAATKDTTLATEGRKASHTGTTTRARPVTAILRPQGNNAQRAGSASSDPWLLPTSSPGATPSLPTRSEPVLAHHVNAGSDIEQGDNQHQPDSPTMPSPVPGAQRRNRRYSTSSSSGTDSANDKNGSCDDNDDNSNIIDEHDPPSLHIPSPRRDRPASRIFMGKMSSALDGSNATSKSTSRSTTVKTKSSSSNSASASNPSFHELNDNVIAQSDDNRNINDTKSVSQQSAVSASIHNSELQQQPSDINESASADNRHEAEPARRDHSKATSSTPKSIPILIPPTSSTTIAAKPSPTPPLVTTTSRSASKTKRFLSSERMAAAKARLEARRRDKGNGGKG